MWLDLRVLIMCLTKKKSKIYSKSLLLISLKSDIEIDWSILKCTCIKLYPWWMVSVSGIGDISKYILVTTVSSIDGDIMYSSSFPFF